MKTIRLFKEDVYMQETEAVITSMTETKDGRTALTLDRTISFPQAEDRAVTKAPLTAFL